MKYNIVKCKYCGGEPEYTLCCLSNTHPLDITVHSTLCDHQRASMTSHVMIKTMNE